MLIELRVRDYAVIDDLALELCPGLSALSGETGAGKSIIVGALSLLLGGRASSDTIRVGAERALVEAAFDVAERPELLARIADLGHETEDGLLVLRREVAVRGRNRAWINGSPATVRSVGALGRTLVDLHGQHEHQTLLRQEAQQGILDAFGDAEDLARRVRERFETVSDLETRLRTLRERRRDLESRADFLRFQLGEIEAGRLEVGEDAALEDEARRLEHSEELLRETAAIHAELYDGDGAVTDRLSRILGSLARLKQWDPLLEAAYDALQDAYHGLVEVGREFGDYAGTVRHDPGRLAEVRERLDAIHRLKRKYGPELEDVIETRARLRAGLDELEGAGWNEEALVRDAESARADLARAARSLTRRRRKAARRLETDVEDLLPGLGLPGSAFQVRLDESHGVEAGGAERVEFLVSANPGFAPMALGRVASGGELSRIMLALKAILARVDQVPTLVFDEIDAGIGGQVAALVAAELLRVARYHQVFVVTHLPQLACRAQSHLLVAKTDASGLASTRVDELRGEARVREIARMLGGDPESEASREHARELLRAG